MKNIYTFHRYKICIQNAKWAFNKYNKYNHCYPIRSVNEEMQLIFHRIGVSFARLIQTVNNEEVATITQVIDEFENLVKVPGSFFQRIISFLDMNKQKITHVLEQSELNENLNADLDMLEECLNYTNKVVARMEHVLKTSQAIYHDELYHLKSA